MALMSENYIVIQGWMCNELGLSGNELLVFALIHGFSQDGKSKFSGGRKYISETFNISLPTVDRALQKLLDIGYIIKQSSSDFIHTDIYYVDIEVVKNLYQGSKESLSGGSKESLLNNISNNKKHIKNTISKDIVENLPKKNLYQKCIDLINEFTDDDDLKECLIQFLKILLENSRDSGKPLYTNTFKGKLNSLKNLSNDSTAQRKIVLQSIDNGWVGFYELKENKSYSKKSATDIKQHSERIDKKAFWEDVNDGNAEKF